MLPRSLVLVIGLALLVACGPQQPATKAGAGAAPVTLRLGTDDLPGRPSTGQIEHFAAQVESLSGGELRIDPVWKAAGDVGDDDWDQKVARMVMSGSLDLALVPTRAWDLLDVSTLQALDAPMLVTSEELVREIVTGELAEPLLSGLDDVGVRGLALVPEAMRRVMSFGEPLETLADFQGALIRVPASRTTYATFRALGATPDDVTMGEADIRAGTVAAVEASFLVAAYLPRRTAAVANLPLWPKVNSLVINDDLLASLTDQHRDVLRLAATRTRDRAIETMLPEEQAATTFCEWGHQVVNTSARNVAALHAATRSVVEDLETDETTRGLIRDIEALATSIGAQPAVIEPCDGAAGTETTNGSPSAPPGIEQARVFPEGTFRATMPASVLRGSGVLASYVADHAGVWTLAFADGTVVVRDVNSVTGVTQNVHGVYCATSTSISLGLRGSAGQPTCGTFWNGQWALDGDELRFSSIRSADPNPAVQVLLETLFGSVPFVRVD